VSRSAQRIGGPFVWWPSPERIERAHLTHFISDHELNDFDQLMLRSTQDVAWFTEALLEYLGIEFRTPFSEIVDLSEGIALPHWCSDGRLNITTSCLHKHVRDGRGKATALRWESESGRSASLTYAELESTVSRAANALRSLGLAKGDVIALYMPMVPEIVIAMLAIAAIGGVILPLFSGFGETAVLTRLRDGGAKALFTADAFMRRGKLNLMKSVAGRALEHLPEVEAVIVLRYQDLKIEMQPGRDHWWHELVLDQKAETVVEDTAAEDPLLLIYTSGTTGKPKGAVHTHCGFPVKAAQDMAFGTDVHAGDVIYWMTDMGWMMGPWLVFGALLLGATFLLYDGAPNYPGPGRTWELCAQHGVNVLGLSPTLIRSLMPLGLEPVRKHDLSRLHTFASTGEPWNPDPWRWLFDQVGGGKRPIINYSGGTEISGGILMGNPLLPLKPCAFSAPCPGIAADVFDEDGQPVRGQVGELVIKAPWIGMTRGFWHDRQRYLDTYWSRWPDVWMHGDYAAVDEDGAWYILGRSDDTLKVAGKRLGPAEVESIVIEHALITEAAAVGIPDEVKGSQLAVFCVLVPGAVGSAAVAKAVREHVISALGKPLAPSVVHFVSDLPKTRNAKVMRRMIRAAYLGLDPGDTSALLNPELLEEFRKLGSSTSQESHSA
jgi:acetyl-CoA synthetase